MPLFFASANQPGLRKRGERGDFKDYKYPHILSRNTLCCNVVASSLLNPSYPPFSKGGLVRKFLTDRASNIFPPLPSRPPLKLRGGEGGVMIKGGYPHNSLKRASVNIAESFECFFYLLSFFLFFIGCDRYLCISFNRIVNMMNRVALQKVFIENLCDQPAINGLWYI